MFLIPFIDTTLLYIAIRMNADTVRFGNSRSFIKIPNAKHAVKADTK